MAREDWIGSNGGVRPEAAGTVGISCLESAELNVGS